MIESPLADQPLQQPPRGQHSDFNARAHDATTLWILSILSISFAFLAVFTRYYVKLFVSAQKLTWDDGVCFLALAASIAQTSIILEDLNYGLGKSMWNVRAVSLTHEKIVKFVLFYPIISLNMMLVRIAVLALYQRLFGIYELSKKLILAGYFIAILIAIPDIGVAIGRLSLCTSNFASQQLKFCFQSTRIANVTFVIAGALTDVYIYSIAIVRVRFLQVKKKKKIQLTVIFGFGLVAVGLGLCNLVFNSIYYETKNYFWFALWTSLLKILEANIALTCLCAAFFPALWKARRTHTNSVHSAFRSQSAINSENSASAKSNLPKPRDSVRDSDEELMLSPLQPLKPILQGRVDRALHGGYEAEYLVGTNRSLEHERYRSLAI